MAQTDRTTGLVGEAGMKVPVRACTTAAIVLSGEQTIDGVALVTGDRCLVNNQASSVDNGIYVVDTGAWSRSKDCDGSYDLVQGSIVHVYGGTTNGNKVWRCTTANSSATNPYVVIGTASIVFAAMDIQLTGSAKTVWCGTATGGPNALVLTPINALAAGDIVAGLTLIFKKDAADNNAASTINVSGTGALAAQADGAAMVGGEMKAAKWFSATLDGTGTTYQVQQVAPAMLLSLLTGQGDIPVATAAGKVTRMGQGMALWNGTLVPSQNGTVLTVAVKTTSGADPSDADPVFVYFRNPTSKTGDITIIRLNAATSVSTTVGGTFGVANSVAFRLWVVGFNDGGTFRLALINCLTTVAGAGAGRDVTAIYPLAQFGIASSTQIGVGSTSAGVFYSAGAAVVSKAYATLGYLTYEAGLAAAGTFGIDQSRTDLFRVGTPLPGQAIQIARNDTGAVATGTTTVPLDDTFPQNTEGDQYLSQAITPSSAANALRARSELELTNANGAGTMIASLYQDATANALASALVRRESASVFPPKSTLDKVILASLTTATTFKVRAGDSAAGTTTFNGSAGARFMGGGINSYIETTEIMG